MEFCIRIRYGVQCCIFNIRRWRQSHEYADFWLQVGSHLATNGAGGEGGGVGVPVTIDLRQPHGGGGGGRPTHVLRSHSPTIQIKGGHNSRQQVRPSSASSTPLNGSPNSGTRYGR